MILSGNEIKIQQEAGMIFIEDFDDARLGPNSYNLRLGNKLLTYTNMILDAKRSNDVEELTIPPDGIVLAPGHLYLGETMEYTKTDGFVPLVEGRSSSGRLGINIHATAGFGDVGFCGRWTLELSCVQPVKIYAGMEICQIYYNTICGKVTKKYTGKYQGSDGVRASKMWQDFEGKK
jgi:dCTP deaminase